MTTAVFTPTRHPGIDVTFHSIMKQTSLPKYWIIADQLDRQDLIFEKCKNKGITPIYGRFPVKEGNAGNLEQVSNWALQTARELEVDLLVFLQDYIWIPQNGIEMFENDAHHHPFSLLTGRCDGASGPRCMTEQCEDPWSIFYSSLESIKKPDPPYTIDPRVLMEWKKGYISNHGWEINWGAMPYEIIHCGVDFDEDYDKGTQWGNTQFSFNVLNHYEKYPHFIGTGGRVFFNPENHAYGFPHRDYFPATHEGERKIDNGALFWSKNTKLKTRAS